MTSIVPFQATDLFRLNPVNLDVFTENFPLTFYFQYLSEWPTLFYKSIEPTYNVELLTNEFVCSGYMMGKTEGRKMDWHAHITAVTVNPAYRRLGLASLLCVQLEELTKSDPYNVYFVDLFVKVTNKLALVLYEKLGYSVYRRVVGYYGSNPNPSVKDVDDDTDAYDMRKAMMRDTKKQSVRANGRDVRVLPHEINFD
ncbi:peptide alpha-N-acetyltransferase complex B subunit [Saccharomycopsis crataegensis]|uniref:Peptide alpha-N-acetyltransferase complex B subunit n=1 Tax=Saccharomycopsis crataegensis TaxID=43959 RepID=A0AAV5QLE9_9ASCO|nr:peptide alpha-N-acetyltransferase complex B subunit [Saccharomycopsis crataegensis]